MPDPNDNNSFPARHPLTEWSKWLININVFATTGCIVGLKTAGAAREKTGIFFFFANVAFRLSVTCANLFLQLTARGPLPAEWTTLKLYWMPVLQWVLFVAGIVFVLTWITYLSKTL